jgi:threonyl-tRNA synthetase
MDNYIQDDEFDHRRIGKEQELFSFHEEGPGFPFYHPKGMALKNELIKLWRKEHFKENYQEIESPILLDRSLWEKSGHWDLFKENMFISKVVDGREYAIKPMSCPGAILYYGEKKRSFRELPLKICELGHVHRNENSGSLHGLLRARSFVQDDAHIFCSEEQLENEIKKVLILFKRVLKVCGFSDFEFDLSVRSEAKKEKYLGSNSDWKLAENALMSALQDLGHPFEKKEGEAKFYGPSIDLHIKDSMNRRWQCSTIQLDFNLPSRFDVHYFDQEGKKKVPFILHRALFGSLERFIGVLLEHYKGELPLWLSPLQVRVISVKPEVSEYAKGIREKLIDQDIRVDLDLRDENLSEKVKRAQREKASIILIIGKKEMEQNKVSLRMNKGKQKNLVEWNDLLEILENGELP